MWELLAFGIPGTILVVGLIAQMVLRDRNANVFHLPGTAEDVVTCTCGDVFYNKLEFGSHKETYTAFGDTQHDEEVG